MIMATSRPVRRTYSSRAAAHSRVAVICGTPMPRTSLLVHAAPRPDTHQQPGNSGLH